MIKKFLVWTFGILGGLLLFNSLIGSMILDTWEFDKKIVDTNLIGSIFIGMFLAVLATIIHDSTESQKTTHGQPKELKLVPKKQKAKSYKVICEYCDTNYKISEDYIGEIKCPNCGGPHKPYKK